ncbi:MAG: hypothetical protein ACQEQJ_00600 [Halobacteriota archaeon]|uniref:hypothetical protein n=1 Tax=Halodesulfurarchaeum sp. HSR-GB TaxID=3074077 RepID=UPI0028577FC8|nr:hypothetical protein [Halodesulfurarchaeum sp. HSR-GB]MDR5655672.1 hypothetical protein [Halodesulfurarchaeum sp. HSR-GB]
MAGTIAALTGFLFVSLAFSGQFNFVHGGVFLVFFVVVMVFFANVINWAESLESR